MIKSGLKNYFINLKHFFTPIGTLAVGLIIGLSILIPATLSIISELSNKLIDIVKDANIDFDAVKSYIVEAIKALDWNDPVASLKTMLSRSWLNGVVNDCLKLVSGGLQPYGDAITEAVSVAVRDITLLFALLIVLCVIGIICGFLLTRFLVRRTMVRRTFKKFLFAAFVDAVVTATLLSLCFWLSTQWKPSIFISSVVSLLLFAFISLVSAYLVHGRDKVDFKTVINFKNAFKLFSVNALIFFISLLFLFVTAAVTNPIAGVFIGFSFVEIAFLVMSMNAESYVINLSPEPLEEREEEFTPAT